MATNLEVASEAAALAPVVERVHAVGRRWHTKRHPYSREFRQAGHAPHDHNALMFRFCRAAGLSDAEVQNMKMTLV
jgi:hypothetical protein